MQSDRVASDIFAIYFSNFSAHQVEYKGLLYPTVEHAYHCARYNNPGVIAEIMAAPSPEKAWEVAQKYKVQQHSDFGDKKRAIMKEIVRAKVDQHELVRQALIDTGDLPIIKHVITGPPDNGFWGDGADGNGANEFGKILMEIRNELQSST